MSGPIGHSELLIVLPILAGALLIVVYPAARICRRLGFHPVGILSVLPVANLVLLWFVALSDWPGGRGR